MTVQIVGFKAFAAALLILANFTHAAEPRKLAFLVGVAEYQKDGLTNLNYADDDAEALQAALAKLGFEVEVLLRTEATGANVRARFAEFLNKTKQLGKEDVVLVSLSGHGIQVDLERDGVVATEAFYCPYDALKGDPATLVPINDLIRGLQDSSGSSQNLMVIDACRNDPTRGGKGLDGSTVRELPAKLSLLFGCSTGQQSFESDKVKHGILTYVLLEGLKGEAADRRGVVSWLTLAHYAVSEVPVQARLLLENETITQRPNLVGNLTLVPVLARIEATPTPPTPTPSTTAPPPRTATPTSGKPGDVITNSIGMKLVLIPAGEFQMGSPDSESDASKNEMPQHRVQIAKPFYLGQTEVTQGQWQALMGTTPWRDQPLVREGADYAATFVSHDNATEFCRKLSVKERKSYRLPTEVEWEYACRAGTTTKYSFGDESLHGEYGWIDCNNLDATHHYAHAVGQKRPNPWNLYDMHGNIYEWCSDWYEENHYLNPRAGGPHSGWFRVIRGGSWSDTLSTCRSAFRCGEGPSNHDDNIGFRIVLVSTSTADAAPPSASSLPPNAPSVIPNTGKPGDVITNSIGMKLAPIPAGEFMMGSPDGDKGSQENSKPQHRVRITKPFYMGQSEVTKRQWQAVMGDQSSSHIADLLKAGKTSAEIIEALYIQNLARKPTTDESTKLLASVNDQQHPSSALEDIAWALVNSKEFSVLAANRPATHVSWNDAAEFCRKLSQKEGITYRLPTEAEWEYACRAGTATKHHCGDNAADLENFAWFAGNAIKGEYARPVEQKRPNAWGLYDMHGNVAEWCEDTYYADFYKNSPLIDPVAPENVGTRVMRGGHWSSSELFCRSDFRFSFLPTDHWQFLGFRVVMVR